VRCLGIGFGKMEGRYDGAQSGDWETKDMVECDSVLLRNSFTGDLPAKIG
jgi:hypothetical protein